MEDTFSQKYLFRFLSFPYDGCKHPPLGGPSKGQFDVSTQFGLVEAWEGRNERELQLPLGCFFVFSVLLENLPWRSDCWIQLSKGPGSRWHIVGPSLPSELPQGRILTQAGKPCYRSKSFFFRTSQQLPWQVNDSKGPNSSLPVSTPFLLFLLLKSSDFLWPRGCVQSDCKQVWKALCVLFVHAHLPGECAWVSLLEGRLNCLEESQVTPGCVSLRQ